MGVGLVLIENGLITQSDRDRALREQSSTGDRLDRVLVRMGVVTRDQVLDAIGSQFGMPVVDLSATAVERAVLGALPTRLDDVEQGHQSDQGFAGTNIAL